MHKTFVVGDIHGCHASLLSLFAKLEIDPLHDTLVFLGDYIDRGPDSKGVVQEVLRLRKEIKRCVTLMGNHEYMLLRFLAGHDREMFLQVGGQETLASYGIGPHYDQDGLASIPAEHLGFFNDLLTSWEDDSYIYVHAGLQPGVHLSQQSKDWMLWARAEYLESDYDFGKPVVSGHTPFRSPQVDKNKIIIDTGAVYGGMLTCLVLPDMEVVQVPGEDGANFAIGQGFL